MLALEGREREGGTVTWKFFERVSAILKVVSVLLNEQDYVSSFLVSSV